MNLFEILWASLAGIAILLEIVAALTKHSTFSAFVWKYITGRPGDAAIPKWAKWVGRFVLAGFAVWLVPHLIFGIWG